MEQYLFAWGEAVKDEFAEIKNYFLGADNTIENFPPKPPVPPEPTFVAISGTGNTSGGK